MSVLKHQDSRESHPAVSGHEPIPYFLPIDARDALLVFKHASVRTRNIVNIIREILYVFEYAERLDEGSARMSRSEYTQDPVHVAMH